MQSLELSPSVHLRQKYRTAFFAKDARNGILKCVFVVLAHVSIAAIACVFAHFCLEKSTLVGVVVWVFAGVVAGSRMRALGNILHECSHHAFGKTRSLNKNWGHLLSIFLFMGFLKYRREHLSHHRYLGDALKDLDLGGTFFKPTLLSAEEPLWTNVARVLLLATFIALLAFPGGKEFVLGGYFIPYFTSYQVFRWLSDKADHAGISSQPNEFLRSRNHIFKSSFMNLWVFPHHDAYHLVHHLFPGLPAHTHSKCHSLLLNEPVYAEQKHFI